MDLERFFTEHNKCALAFSGGLDSSYLLYAAKIYGVDIFPYFIKTQFQPDFELKEAEEFCATLSTKLNVIELDALLNENVVRNDGLRCYHCKKMLFSLLIKNAKANGYNVVIDGTNASDNEAERPGMRALKELGVLSPLRECNLSKKEISRLAKEAGLPVWNKPSYSCLATRISTRDVITEGELKKIERGEKALRDIGFTDFRLRVDGKMAKLQITANEMCLAFSLREKIKEVLREDFADIVLDLTARSSSIV